MRRPKKPLIAFAAHGVEGGSRLLTKLLFQSCRGAVTSALGDRCAFPINYDGCDPETVDVCVLAEGRFGAARYVDRGYRMVHILRNPSDVIIRSFLLAFPNATHTHNMSTVAAMLDDHFKSSSAAHFQEMTSMAEVFATDTHVLQVKVEDILDTRARVHTLTQIASFVLDRRVDDLQNKKLVDEWSQSLLNVELYEQQGELQRAHLMKILLSMASHARSRRSSRRPHIHPSRTRW